VGADRGSVADQAVQADDSDEQNETNEKTAMNATKETKDQRRKNFRERLQLIHAILWLSLTTYAWEDYDSVCGAFYNGLYYLEDCL
jgi:hypothetical protein